MIKLLKKENIAFIALFIVLAAGLILRLWKINYPIADWHSWRQADTASVSLFFYQNGIDILHPRYHDISDIASGFANPEGWRFVEFPIFNAVHAAAALFFPQLPFDTWGRLTSVIASFVSTIFIFLIGRRIIGNFAGILAATFFAVLPFNVFFSRVVLPEPLAVAFILASIWFFIIWLDSEKIWKIVLSSIFFALAILVKPYVGFYGIALVYLAFAKHGFLGSIRHPGLWFFLSFSLSPLLAWRGWMWQDEYFRGIPHWKWAFNGDEIRARPSFWWWIFGERVGRMILGIWLAIPVFAGLAKREGRYPLFLHFLFFSQVAYFLTIATANVRHDYYQTLSIPALSLILGAGVVSLWNISGFDKLFVRIGLITTVAFSLFYSFYTIRGFYNINHPEIIMAGATIDRLAPKDALVIAPYDGDTAFLYQTKRRGWPYVTKPIPEMIERLGADYYVSVNFDKQTEAIMNEYTVIEKTNEYVVVELAK